MVLFGSGIRDGNKHATKDIPTVLAGGANGQLKTGRHLQTGGAELSNLYVGMLKRLGVKSSKVGDTNSELRGI